jgi:hypothetical protein
MSSETRLLLAGLQRAKSLFRRIANGDQQAAAGAGDLAALLQRPDWPTIAEEQSGKQGPVALQ